MIKSNSELFLISVYSNQTQHRWEPGSFEHSQKTAQQAIMTKIHVRGALMTLTAIDCQ